MGRLPRNRCTPLPPPRGAPGADCFRGVACFLLASSLLLGLLAPSIAADPSPAAAVGQRTYEQKIRDWQLTVYARQALSQDAVLAPLNIGVNVHKGVATLWGPVTSAAVALRARECLRRVPGLDNVCSELYIVDADNPSITPPSVRPAAPPPRPSTPPVPWRQPARLAELSGISAPAPGQTLSSPRPLDPRRPTFEQPVRLQPPQASFTGSIVLDPAVPPTPAAGPAAVLLPPRTRDSNTRLHGDIERLRQSNARFRDIQPTIRGGVVTLRGAASQGEDLMEFARAVGRLPGVERVLLENSRTSSNPWLDPNLRGLRIEGR